MTKQEADFIGSMNMCDEISNEAYKKIMCNCEVEEEECEDCVSREAVLEQAIDYGSKTFLIPVNSVKALSSVTPQPKREKWEVIRKEYEFMGSIVNEPQGCKCSNCGGIVKLKSDFCPNCGADMREVQDER